jgi:hypothetical protein
VDQEGSEPIYSKIISISDSRDTASRINAASTKTVDQLKKERTEAVKIVTAELISAPEISPRV